MDAAAPLFSKSFPHNSPSFAPARIGRARMSSWVTRRPWRKCGLAERVLRGLFLRHLASEWSKTVKPLYVFFSIYYMFYFPCLARGLRSRRASKSKVYSKQVSRSFSTGVLEFFLSCLALVDRSRPASSGVDRSDRDGCPAGSGTDSGQHPLEGINPLKSQSSRFVEEDAPVRVP